MRPSLIKIKALLLIISLNVVACAVLPPFPAVNQCAYSVKFNKFRCCNTETKNCFNLVRDDGSMEAAQCLSADDYKKSTEWIDIVKQIAETRCR